MQHDSPPNDSPWSAYSNAPVIINNPRNVRCEIVCDHVDPTMKRRRRRRHRNNDHNRHLLNNDGNQIAPDFSSCHGSNHRSTGFCPCPIYQQLHNPTVTPSPVMFTNWQASIVPTTPINWGMRLYDPTPPVVPHEYLDNSGPSPPVIPGWSPPSPVVPDLPAPVSPSALSPPLVVPFTPPYPVIPTPPPLVVPYIPPSPVIPTPPPLSEITLHYQLRQHPFPALHWDIIHPPNTARLINYPTAFGVVLPDFHASAFMPDTVRDVPCTSRHPMLRYWMSLGRWGPLVIRGFDTITVREVLQQIFSYLYYPLTEVEVNWISRTPPNRNRLELAKLQRNFDVFGWQPLDGTFLRTDMLGGHRRFGGLEMVLEHGEWKLCVDFTAGPIPRLWDTI